MAVSERDDGGPAFPKPLDPYPNCQATADPGDGSNGMSMRQWYAGRALSGILSGSLAGKVSAMASDHGMQPTELLAALSFEYADAMLEREKK